MNATPMIRIACVLLASLFVTTAADAASSSSANFITPRDVIGSGGTTSSSSANFSMGGTLGQPVVGSSSSANFKLSAGFWPDTTITFAFTAQINAALLATVTSNIITIAGLSGPAAITIVGGTYSINGGAFTAAPGTVNNGDTVAVRLISSSLYSTTTLATATIDGVSGDFSVTTAAAPPSTPTVTGPNGGGSGTITATVTPGPGQPATCGFGAGSQFIPLVGAARSPPTGSAPNGVAFPFGLFDFTLVGCAPGGSVSVTVVYPQTVPLGAKYWKYGPTAATPSPHWYVLPATFSANTATIAIVDGGLGDDDLTANGMIVDQGGPGIGGTDPGIPTLSEWALLLLAALIGSMGMFAVPRRTRLERSS